MVDLGAFPATAISSFANEVSPNGFFVVGQGVTTPNEVDQPILWDVAAGTAQRLGSLPFTAFAPEDAAGVFRAQAMPMPRPTTDQSCGVSSIDIQIGFDFRTEVRSFI
jgi:uncharacterized iron-regulated membrane protein